MRLECLLLLNILPVMSDDTANNALAMLIILDGWGHSDAPENNAIAAANTPTWDRLWAEAPHTLISGSGLDVGLPDGQMGNSEVGHMNLGAGRVVDQDLTRITKSIEDGSFCDNAVLQKALGTARDTYKAVHVFGLLSPGGVHSHEDHIQALVKMAARNGCPNLFVHAFLDGRDTPPRSAQSSISALEQTLSDCAYTNICTITGRYYVMDRDKRWDRVQSAYDLLTTGESVYVAETAALGLEQAYARGENDEFVNPTAICADEQKPVIVRDGDVVIFMNFRADRARQITQAFTQPDFDHFARKRCPATSHFVSLTRYADNLDTEVVFDSQPIKNSLGEYLSDLGHAQLRIAETEKYAHVTFFFSGGRETPFKNETRLLIPSPDVATYDLKPQMSAPELTDKLIEAIHSGNYKTIICNFANADMVGHTGIFDAAVLAVETLDACLARIVEAIRLTGSQCLVTADHGNVERMYDSATGDAHTAHTSHPVPLVYIGPEETQKNISLRSGGCLSDVAPTLLDLMQLKAPAEMTGHSLVDRNS